MARCLGGGRPDEPRTEPAAIGAGAVLPSPERHGGGTGGCLDRVAGSECPWFRPQLTRVKGFDHHAQPTSVILLFDAVPDVVLATNGAGNRMIAQGGPSRSVPVFSERAVP